MQVMVEIPDDFVRYLVPEGKDAADILLEESVASAYRERRLTMEQVRVILGLPSRLDVDRFLGQHGIYDYAIADFESDLQTHDALIVKQSAIR